MKRRTEKSMPSSPETLFGHLPGMVYRCRNVKQYTMEFVSQGCRDLTGYTPDELVINKIDFGRLIHPDDRKKVWEKVQEALKKGTHFLIEYRIITKDGREKWVWERGVGLASKSDKVKTLEGYITDITEWKKSEIARQQSEERLRAALKNRPVMVATIDKDLRYTWIYNPHPDFKEEEVIGKSDLELADNEGTRKLTRLKKEAIDTGKSLQDEITFDLSDGKHTYDILLEPTTDESGKITGLTTASFDITGYKNIEESLRNNERFLKAVIATSPAAIHGIDHESKIIFWNESSEKIFGWKENEVIGKKLPIVPEDKWSEHLKFRKRVLSGQRIEEAEVVRQKKDGTRFIGKFSVVPISGVNNEVIGAVASMEDITRRKKAEEELRKSEEKYRTLFETMAQGVVYQDTEGQIISANPSAERILGLDLDQMQGRKSIDPRWKSIREDGSPFPGEQHPAMQALKTGKKVTNTLMGVFNPLTEKYSWIHVNAIPMYKKGSKRPYRVYTTFEDITERKLAEDALLRSEERFRSVMENIQLIGLMLDKKGNITFANDYLLELTGWKRQDIMNKNWFEYFIPEDIQEEIKIIFENTIRKGDSPGTHENKIITKSGRTRIVKWSNTLLLDRDRKPVGATSIGEDVTEQRRMEKELIAHREHLEELVTERTRDLEEKNRELERFNKLFVGREFRIKELKNKVQTLEEEVKMWKGAGDRKDEK